MEYKDYYAILGVDKNADEKAIRKAYRRLARKHHPDVNPGDKSSEEKFKEINEAQEVLLDPEKRKLYDRFGAQWEQYQRAGIDPDTADWSQFRRQGAPAGGANYRTVSPEEFEEMFGGGGGFSSFFEEMFGGGNPRTRQAAGDPFARRAANQRGRDLEHPVTVSLEEAFHGASRTLQYEDGRAIEARIPRGVQTGSKVRLSGQGGQGSGQAASGDLYLLIDVEPHPVFDRSGDDLNVVVPVDLYTALLGGKAEVQTVDQTVRLTIPPETPNGKTFRLRGLGMPKLRNREERGDLFATVSVELPKNLTQEEKRLFEQLRQMRQ